MLFNDVPVKTVGVVVQIGDEGKLFFLKEKIIIDFPQSQNAANIC